MCDHPEHKLLYRRRLYLPAGAMEREELQATTVDGPGSSALQLAFAEGVYEVSIVGASAPTPSFG